MNVSVKQLEQVFEFVSKMPISERFPILLWGYHGIGKTSIPRKKFGELGYEVVVLNLANQTPEDLLGMCDRIDGRSTFLKPDWLKTDSEKPVVYFLDEINRAPKYVLQSIYNFLLEGRIHTHQIRENDLIIAAANPDTPDFEVSSFDDLAFISRFCHLYLEPTRDEALQYFAKTASTIIYDMVKESFNTIYKNVNPNDKVSITADPRALEKVSFIEKRINKEQMEDFGYSLISGLIGTEMAGIFYAKWKKSNEIPDVNDLVKNPQKVNDIDINRLDIINVLNSAVANEMHQKYWKNNSFKTSKQFDNFFPIYGKHIPRDMFVSLIEDLRNKITKGDGKLNNIFSTEIIEYGEKINMFDFFLEIMNLKD